MRVPIIVIGVAAIVVAIVIAQRAAGPQGTDSVADAAFGSGRGRLSKPKPTDDALDSQTSTDLYLADSIIVEPAQPVAGEPVTFSVTAAARGAAGYPGALLVLAVDSVDVFKQSFDLAGGASRRLTATFIPMRPKQYRVRMSVLDGSASNAGANDLTNNTRSAVVRVR